MLKVMVSVHTKVCDEYWRRVLNSSKVPSGVTDLRKKLVLSICDNLSNIWTELKLDWRCFFWWQATWSCNAETELHDVWASFPTAVFFQVSAAPVGPFVYTHTTCSTSK